MIRNKIRRRLREIVRDLGRESSGAFPAGLYLIGTKQGSGLLSYADLRISVQACLTKLGRVKT